jgi:hypothetical protein
MHHYVSAFSSRSRWHSAAAPPACREPVNSFTAFDINGWTALSDTKLVVWTGVNEAWLLTVWNGCQELSFVDRIRIKSTGSAVMRGDTVIVRRDRCPISEIRPIDVRQMRADREAAAAPKGQ